ncbi:MAG: hypothetical protein AAGF98_15435 [Cyanobacteria bacterium P01_H01_bin.153]
MSVLTGRYSGSPESAFDGDIRRINEYGMERYLAEVEAAALSDAFWGAALPQQMNTSVASSSYFKVFLAAQVRNNDKGFLSKDITVQDLITHRGDIHHVFPKGYLKGKGLTRGRYNQIANYVIMQSEINIAIGNKAPFTYFSQLKDQCESESPTYGAITDFELLWENFRMNAIPENMHGKSIDDYEGFLQERRRLMAQKIKAYYFSL